MTLPPIVSIAEMSLMLGVSKNRTSQLADRRDFPDHYVRLSVGRIWHTDDVLRWAYQNDRSVNLDIPEASSRGPRIDGSSSNTRNIRGRTHGKYPLGGTQGDPQIVGSVGSLVTILPEEKNTEVAEKPSDPSFASLTTDPRLSPTPEPDSGPSRRTAAELNQEALSEDWDNLERIYKIATGKLPADLAESEIELVGLATMIFTNQGNVPNYRKTKTAMVRAWKDVRRAYDATPEELVALARHLMLNADTPFTAGAVKKFSDYEIAKIRRTSVKPGEGERKQPNRWQGKHGAYEDQIAALSDEEKRRYGVQPR